MPRTRRPAGSSGTTPRAGSSTAESGPPRRAVQRPRRNSGNTSPVPVPLPQHDRTDLTMNKGVLAVVVVFFGFWLFTDPHGLAPFTQPTGDAASNWGEKLFNSVIEYLGDL